MSNNQPAKKLRDGLITVTLWENKTDDKSFYTATVERSYQDGEEWKSTSQLTGIDMIKASRLLEKAYDTSVDLRSASS